MTRKVLKEQTMKRDESKEEQTMPKFMATRNSMGPEMTQCQ